MKEDTQIYTDVMEKLNFEPFVDPAKVTLSVQQGVVTLQGIVRHYAEKKAIERAVRGVQGVKGIANDLEVSLSETLKRDDTDIAKAALNALEWDVNVPDEKIKVTVEHGKIKLTGEVDWWYHRQAAEKAVRYLTGVTGIDNQLRVKPAAPFVSPSAVKEKISKEFERNALIDAQGIRVEVSDGAIALQGKVKSWAEYNEANHAAWSIPGVKQVSNQLTVNA